MAVAATLASRVTATTLADVTTGSITVANGDRIALYVYTNQVTGLVTDTFTISHTIGANLSAFTKVGEAFRSNGASGSGLHGAVYHAVATGAGTGTIRALCSNAHDTVTIIASAWKITGAGAPVAYFATSGDFNAGTLSATYLGIVSGTTYTPVGTDYAMASVAFNQFSTISSVAPGSSFTQQFPTAGTVQTYTSDGGSPLKTVYQEQDRTGSTSSACTWTWAGDEYEEVYLGLIFPASGASNWTATPTDAEGLLDSQSLVSAYARPIGPELEGLLDSQVLAAVYARAQTDPEGLLDFLNLAAVYVRSQTDPLGLLDAIVRAGVFARTQGPDPLGLLDSMTDLAVYARPFTEPEGLLDSIATVVPYLRSQTDPLGLLDSMTAVKSGDQTFTDPEGLSDSALTVSVYARPVTDPEGLLDVLVTVQAHGRTVTDPENLLDAMTVLAAYQRPQTDPLGLVDPQTVTVAYSRPAGDLEGLTDDLVVLQTFAYADVELDALGLTDPVLREAVYPRTATDLLGLTDTMVADLHVNYVVLLGDLLGMTDQMARTAGVNRTFTDGESLPDDLETSGGRPIRWSIRPHVIDGSDVPRLYTRNRSPADG